MSNCHQEHEEARAPLSNMLDEYFAKKLTHTHTTLEEIFKHIEATRLVLKTFI